MILQHMPIVHSKSSTYYVYPFWKWQTEVLLQWQIVFFSNEEMNNELSSFNSAHRE